MHYSFLNRKNIRNSTKKVFQSTFNIYFSTYLFEFQHIVDTWLKALFNPASCHSAVILVSHLSTTSFKSSWFPKRLPRRWKQMEVARCKNKGVRWISENIPLKLLKQVLGLASKRGGKRYCGTKIPFLSTFSSFSFGQSF